MKLTKKGEYSLKALLALASVYEQKKVLALKDIARQENISFKFLEQIMMMLKHAGFVESIMGKHGGYRLAHPPKEISLGEIIRAVEGPLAPLGTAAQIQKKIEKGESHPGLYCLLLEVRDAISNVLDQKTLADVCELSNEMMTSKSKSNMYYI